MLINRLLVRGCLLTPTLQLTLVVQLAMRRMIVRPTDTPLG